MLLILLWWVLFFMVCLGAGLGGVRLISAFIGEAEEYFDLFRVFWLGLIVVIGLLQVYSLVLPVNGLTLLLMVVFSLIACASSAVTLGRYIKRVREVFFPVSTAAVLSITLFILLTFLLFSASQHVLQWDAYEYHFNSVRWAGEYPVVPGLVLFSPKLAFNSSFFLFAALQDSGLMEMRSAHSALSFLIAILSIQWVITLADRSVASQEKIFLLLVAPFLLAFVILSNKVASLSTDLSMSVIFLALCFELIRKDPLRLIMVAGLSATLLSFKLSGLAAVLIFALATLFELHKASYLTQTGAPRRIVLLSVGLFSVVTLGFLARNVILSGWLFFPVPLGFLNLRLPWSIHIEDVKHLTDMITGFARNSDYGMGMAKGFTGWLVNWLVEWKQTIYVPVIFVGTLMNIANVTIRPLRAELSEFKSQYIFLLLLSVFSLAIWASSAPNPRFGAIFFCIFFSCSFMPLILLLQRKIPEKTHLLASTIVFVALYMAYSSNLSYPILKNPIRPFFSIEDPSFVTLEEVQLTNESPPLYSFKPEETGRHVFSHLCGNSPIPCIKQREIEFMRKYQIQQREPGNLAKGFSKGTP